MLSATSLALSGFDDAEVLNTCKLNEKIVAAVCASPDSINDNLKITNCTCECRLLTVKL